MKLVTVRTFLAYVEDRPGVLNRVTSLFRRRGFNIESLTVGRTERPGVSRVTLVIRADDDAARRLEANLYKLVNVLLVEDVTHAPTVVRELALIKVRASGEVRATVMQLCEVFRARMVDVAPETLMVEITGAGDKIDGLIEMLLPAASDENIGTFFNEQLGSRQRHAARSTCNDCNFSFKLSHDFSFDRSVIFSSIKFFGGGLADQPPFAVQRDFR